MASYARRRQFAISLLSKYLSKCSSTASPVPVRRHATTIFDAFGTSENYVHDEDDEDVRILVHRALLSHPASRLQWLHCSNRLYPTLVCLFSRGFSVYKIVSHVRFLMHRVVRYLVRSSSSYTGTPSKPGLRIYKLCALMYHVFNGTAPQYLAELCQVCSNDRLLSASRQDYIVPCTNTWIFDRHFIFCCWTQCVKLLTGSTSLLTWRRSGEAKLLLFFANCYTLFTFTFTARLATVLKRFYFLSYIFNYSANLLVLFSLSLAYSTVRHHWTSEGGAIANYWLIGWLVGLLHCDTVNMLPLLIMFYQLLIAIASSSHAGYVELFLKWR